MVLAVPGAASMPDRSRRTREDPAMSYNRRKYPRADLVFNVTYREDDREISTRSRDLSAGGISFITEHAFEPDQSLSLSFTLEGLPGQIDARCSVIRSWEEEDTIYTAVLFTEIDDMDLVTVTDYSLAMSDEVRLSEG